MTIVAIEENYSSTSEAILPTQRIEGELSGDRCIRIISGFYKSLREH